MRIRTHHARPVALPPGPFILALAGNSQAPPPAPLLPPPPPAPEFTPDSLQELLAAGMVNLYQAPVRTIRIVAGSAPMIQALLEYVVRRDCVRKLWVEDVPLHCLAHFLRSTPELQHGFTSGLTHLRLRKLVTIESSSLIILRHNAPESDCCPRFMKTIISNSPNLTSLTLETVPGITALPEILEPLTFPALTAFQLRSRTEDVWCAPRFNLTNARIIGFLLRHPKLQAFGWPAEKFVSCQSDEHLLVPLTEHLSRRLVWFRSDCSLLHAAQADGSPNPSRLFMATFLKRMEMLETIKLQGDFLQAEMTAIHIAIGSSASSAKMKKYSLIRPQVDGLDEIVTAMPNLRELKLCAYFTPGLISFYHTAVQGVQENDGPRLDNIALVRIHCSTLDHLTCPSLSGSDNSIDRIPPAYRITQTPSKAHYPLPYRSRYERCGSLRHLGRIPRAPPAVAQLLGEPALQIPRLRNRHGRTPPLHTNRDPRKRHPAANNRRPGRSRRATPERG